MPLLKVLLVSIGICIINISTNLYLVDAFTAYAASALAASAVLCSILGATFPLFALQLYNTLGLSWGNSLLAFIAVVMLAIPPLLLYYSERLRSHPKF